jgi:hypothetical protein
VLYKLERSLTTKKTRSELNHKAGEARSERRYLEGRGDIRTTLQKTNQNLKNSGVWELGNVGI